MKIVILNNKVRESHEHLSGRTISGFKLFSLAAIAIVFLPGAIGVGGYWLASSIVSDIKPVGESAYQQAVAKRVTDQQQEILETRRFLNKNMDALGSRIGSLQAQVSRINAVEMRLADLAGLDLQNFSFNQDPAIGGNAKNVDSKSTEIDIKKVIDSIERDLSMHEYKLSTVDFLVTRNSAQSNQTPTGWPVDNGWISSSFGHRMHPLTGKKQFHQGVDIPSKAGSAVRAVADGVVRRSFNNGVHGWMIEIDHGDDYVTSYSHNRVNFVAEGQTVHQGQQIAEVGSTGRSTGPHVHFEVRKNKRHINPMKYLNRNQKLAKN